MQTCEAGANRCHAASPAGQTHLLSCAGLAPLEGRLRSAATKLEVQALPLRNITLVWPLNALADRANRQQHSLSTPRVRLGVLDRVLLASCHPSREFGKQTSTCVPARHLKGAPSLSLLVSGCRSSSGKICG